MKMIFWRWIVFVLVFGCSYTLADTGSPNSFKIDSSLIIYDWQVIDYKDENGQQISESSEENLFLIQNDGSFFYRINHGEPIELVGTWSIRNDSLILYELIPIESGIDSISYKAEKNIPYLYFFSEGKKVAHYDLDGLSSPKRWVAYAIEDGGDGFINLIGSAQSFTLGGKPILKKTGFQWTDIFRGILGLFCMLLIAWLLSTNRRAINWQLVISGIGIQLIFAILVLKFPPVKIAFEWVANRFVDLLNYSKSGADFVFGSLVTDTTSFGYIFAFQVLPTIVFFSALMSILYYLGLLQKVVYGFAWLMNKTMKLSGAESLAAAGNIFLGQTESPLLIRPYLDNMTRSEMMALMTGGMATIAGSVFAAYIGYLGGPDSTQQLLFATHLLTASIMSAPAALVAAKILVPETEEVNKNLDIPKDKIGSNVLDAIANGTTDGLKLAINVGVMLLVFTALVAMVNGFLSDLVGVNTGLNDWVTKTTDGTYNSFNLQYLFGLFFAPVAWILGVPSEDIMLAGQLLGEKTIINEFFAYTTMSQLKASGMIVNYKSVIITTYALCGFANFASIGIQIGGIGALAPSQRKTLSELGVRSLIGGTIACFMTAAIAGMLVSL